MSAPLQDVATLRRHFDGATQELRLLIAEEARIGTCLGYLRESSTKQAIRDALNELQHRVRCQRSALNRRRAELEAAELLEVQP